MLTLTSVPNSNNVIYFVDKQEAEVSRNFWIFCAGQFLHIFSFNSLRVQILHFGIPNIEDFSTVWQQRRYIYVHEISAAFTIAFTEKLFWTTKDVYIRPQFSSWNNKGHIHTFELQNKSKISNWKQSCSQVKLSNTETPTNQF